MRDIFLCNSCHRNLCNDCREISDEYAELFALRTQALATTESTLSKQSEELRSVKRQLVEWQRMAKLGYAEVLAEWMDSQVEARVAEGSVK